MLPWQCLCGSVSGPTRRPKLVYNKCGGCCSTFLPRMRFQDQGTHSPDARGVGWWWLTGGSWPWAKGTAFAKITHLLWGHTHPMTGQHSGTKAWFLCINLRHLWWDISSPEFSGGSAEAIVPTISLLPLFLLPNPAAIISSGTLLWKDTQISFLPKDLHVKSFPGHLSEDSWCRNDSPTRL